MQRSILFIAATACCAGFAQEPTIIRVPVRIVEVPVAVSSPDGLPVRGLEAREFSLFDNDRSQKFRVDMIEGPLSLAIVVQTSDSVRTWLPQVRRIASTVEALVVGANGEASVTTFSDDVTTMQSLTENTALLDKAFASISVSGYGSRCLDAVAGAARQLSQTSPGRRRVILLIAQAGDSGSSASLRDVIEQLELSNITVYSLVMPYLGKQLIGKTVSVRGANESFGRGDTGFAASLDLGKLIPEIYRSAKAAAAQDYLSVITSEMGGKRIPFRKLHELEKGISSIGEELHTEYVLSFTPDQYEEGYHRLRVQVDRPGVVVRARPGYYVSHSDASR